MRVLAVRVLRQILLRKVSRRQSQVERATLTTGRVDDEQLLRKASSAALDRLRKAELVRLWKVAGLSLDGSDSESEQDESDSESEDGSEIEMQLTKEQLIKGIVEAVSRSVIVGTRELDSSFSLNRVAQEGGTTIIQFSIVCRPKDCQITSNLPFYISHDIWREVICLCIR